MDKKQDGKKRKRRKVKSGKSGFCIGETQEPSYEHRSKEGSRWQERESSAARSTARAEGNPETKIRVYILTTLRTSS